MPSYTTSTSTTFDPLSHYIDWTPAINIGSNWSTSSEVAYDRPVDHMGYINERLNTSENNLIDLRHRVKHLEEVVEQLTSMLEATKVLFDT